MAYVLDKDPTNPTLAQMTEAALQVLQKDDKGYFLLVEGNYHVFFILCLQ